MAKKVRRVGYDDYQRWVGLPHYLLRSPAWKTMSPAAKALLIEVWARFNGSNNGEISYSVREAEKIGINRNTASKAFHELVARGFLRIARQSSFTLKTKEAREWFVTALPASSGGPAPRDFMRWSSETQSLHRDRQSLKRDRDEPDETKLPPSVPGT